MARERLMTALQDAVSDYLMIRRALGFKLLEHERLLNDFVAFLEQAGASTITTELALAWAVRSRGIARPMGGELDRDHPGAAASLREGMEETLAVTRLGITGKLKLTLQSTNPRESMIATVRAIHRNVKNWSSGEMCMRWTAAGMLEAETRFRKAPGYSGLANIAVALERDLIRRRHNIQPTGKEPTTAINGNHHIRTAVIQLPRRAGQPPASGLRFAEPTRHYKRSNACWRDRE
jgi:hypothetical protein